MIFNFFYGNHNRFTLNPLADVVLPIYHGLAEAGHRVIGFGTQLRPAPIVNVLVEFFPIDEFVDALLAAKGQSGDKLVLGVLCTEDVDDPFKMADPKLMRRRPNLLRLLPAVDFVWSLLPQVPFYNSVAGEGKTALVKYGFTDRWLEREQVRNPAWRDIDAILYGDLYAEYDPRRTRVVEGLRRHGFSCFTGYRAGYPNYITDDVMRRAKVSVDVRSRGDVRFLSPTRIMRGLHSGTISVSERYDETELADLYSYTEACAYDDVVERCVQIIRARTYVDLGAAALERFRKETSMRDNMHAALRLPVFERLGAT